MPGLEAVVAIVLIVEDDPLIAWDLSAIIADAIADEVVVATNVAAADEQLSRGLDFALLDVNVGQDTTFALARRLNSQGVPFAFASGSSRAIVPDDLAGVPFLVKP